jgi:hypothetical protein
MKKINMMTADRRFTKEVFEFMYNSVWAWEYHEQLKEAIGKEETAIKGLENSRGCCLTDIDINRAIEEKKALIEKYNTAYNEIVKPWTKIRFSNEMKDLTKAFEEATTRAQVYTAFVQFFAEYGVDADGTDFVDELCDAVSGDSGSGNRKPVTTTGAWAIKKRTSGEFKRIVMRRFADKLIFTGLIRFYGPFNVKTATESYEFELELPELVNMKAELEIAKQKAREEKKAKRAKKN